MFYEKKRALLLILMMIMSSIAGCVDEDGNTIDADDVKDIIDDTNNNSTTNQTGNSSNGGDNNTTPTDTDGDGVVDSDDICPTTPTGDAVDAQGCTLIVDDDGDGINNADDLCPNTPATAQVDNSGCEVAPAIEVKIGLLSPRTGDMATHATAIENAAQLAVDQMNDGQFAYEFTLVIEDSGCAAALAATAAQALADAGVSGIVGPACDAAALSAMAIAQAEMIPMISYGATAPDISTADDGNYLWRVVASTAYEGIAAATWAQLAQITDVAVLAKNTSGEADIASAFLASAQAAGVNACYASFYDEGTTDFSTDVAAIKAAECDGVFLVSTFSDGSAIIEELDAQELLGEDGLTVVGHGGIGDANFADELSNPGLLDGVYGSRVSAPAATNTFNVFYNAYLTEYGSAPGDYTAEAFDATRVLLKAVEVAESTTGSEVMNKLMSIGTDYSGATGDFSFQDNGDVPGAHFEFWKFTCDDCDADGVGTSVAFEVVATWSPYNGVWANCRANTPLVNIGVLFPATGSNSEGAEGYVNGVELAAMLINVQQRDVCFAAISVDTESTATGAAAATQNLIDAGVVGIVGAAGCAETMAATDVAVASKMPIISYACTSPELTNYDDGADTYGHGYLWRTTYSDAWPADAAADFAAAEGLSSIAVYRTDDALGETLADSLESAVGSTLCADITFTPGSLGTTSDAAGCDAVVIFADASDSAMIVDDLNANSYTGQIIGNGAMDSAEFDAAVTSSTEGMVIVGFSDESFSSSLSDAFNVAYWMNYGTAPPANSAEAADGGLMIALSFIYGYNVGLSGISNSEYVNWFFPAIADNYAGASGYLTVDADTGDMPSKGNFEVQRMEAGTLTLEYTWDPTEGLAAADE